MKWFVTVKTKAREERVKALDATHFDVFVKTLPIEGKANEAVVRVLARFLGVAPATLTLRSGATYRHKVFERKETVTEKMC